MSNKRKILLVVIFCCMAFVGFYLSVVNSSMDSIGEKYATTINGDYYRKNLSVLLGVADTSEQQKTVTQVQTLTGRVSATAGKPQGLWSNSSGETITADQFLDYTRQTYGSYADTFINAFGLAMEDTNYSPDVIQVDPLKDKFGDGIGLIHYLQGGDNPWSNINQNIVVGGSATISSSGCGPTGLSIIFSSLLHRYITPAEVVAARDTYDLRYPGDTVSGMRNKGGAGAMVQTSPDIVKFVEDQKYNGKSLFICTQGKLSQAKLDETLNAGGMALLVAHKAGSATGKYWTKGGHYIVIRLLKDGMYYTTDGTHDNSDAVLSQGNHDVAHPYSDIDGCGHDTVQYIVPGPGYADYLSSLSK